jgi:anti-sigma factor RsiW
VTASLCDTIDTLAMVFLDDELDAAERRELELHLHDCATCREHVAAERKSRVALRARLAPPPAPALLRARIARSLDAADRTAAGERRSALSRWILPSTGVAAAAAALVLFVAMPPAPPATTPTRGRLTAEAVREQAAPVPLEVQGPDTRMWLARNVGPGVEVPRFDDSGGIREVGARRVSISGHEGAQIFYELPFGPTRFELYAVVLGDVDPDSMSGSMRVSVQSGHMWVTELNGPRGRTSVVTYVDAYRNGYMFMSTALTPQALLDVVVETDLIRRARARIR